MAEYIEKQKAIKLLDMCMVAAEKRWKEATNPLAKIEFKADKDTIEAMIEVIVSVESADVQPLSVVAEHIKNRLYETAFNTTEEKARDAIADMAERIDFWIDELKDGDTNG